MKDFLLIAWYIYVLIMSPFMLFSGGFEQFLVGMLAVLVLLVLPFIFYKS